MTATVVFSREFAPETAPSMGNEVVKCVTRGLAETTPEIRIVSEEEFTRKIFGVKAGEVLLRRDTLGVLLTRPDVSERIGHSGLTHLIVVEGVTHNDLIDSGTWEVPYLTMGAWFQSKRTTQFTATIFELKRAASVELRASAEGRRGFAVGIPLPVVGWAHATESASCRALAAGVAQALRGQSQDRGR